MGDVKWSAELEVALFHSMHGHKPVGETGGSDYHKSRPSLGSWVEPSLCLLSSMPRAEQALPHGLHPVAAAEAAQHHSQYTAAVAASPQPL